MRSSKKALAATAGFLACLILICVGVTWPYLHGQTVYYEDAAVRDELAGSIDMLISGASHGACAFDTYTLDAELGANSYNLSGPLMTMDARKILLQKELDRNPVKTVFIELSCNSLTRDRKTEGPEGDIYALPRMGNLMERTRFFFHSFRKDEQLAVCADTLNRGIEAWKSVFRGETQAIDPANKGFLPRDSHDMSMTRWEFSRIHNTVALSEEDLWSCKTPLYEMIKTCQSRGIEVVLVVTPLSDRLLANYNNLEQSHQWYLYCAESRGCTFLDFNLYRRRPELFPNDTAFFDDYHMSTEGAQTFTRELIDLCGRIRAGEDVSDLFYANYGELDQAMCEVYGTQ